MQSSVSVEQLGQHELVAMSNSLEELLVHISPDTLAHVPDVHQERIQSWIEGNRLMPRLLIPYLDEEFLVNDFEPRDLPFVSEELADACRLAGIAQPEIAGLDTQQVEVLLNWIDTVHMQSHLAFKNGRQPVFTLYPSDQLAVAAPVIPADEPGEVPNPFAEAVESPSDWDQAATRGLDLASGEDFSASAPVQTGPGTDDIVGESEPAHPVEVLAAATDAAYVDEDGDEEPDESTSYENETRAEAKLRLEEEMHYAKEALISLTGEYEVAKEDAKFAKARMSQAQVKLNEIVRELDDVNRDGDWQPRLPLDRGEQPEPVASPGKDPALTAAIHELAKFGATEKQCDKLVDAQIETIKEFEDRLASGNPITKIKGIGQAAADTFADALVGWRNENGYVAVAS